MRVGEWNVAIGCVGGPGCGKSTYQQWRARQIAAQTPCYVIAHDPTLSIRGGDVRRHNTSAALLRSLATPGQGRGIQCYDVANGLDVIKLGLEIAAAARTQKDPIPTLVLLDEIVAVGNMSPSYLDPVMQEAYAMRRHRHIGFVFCSQRTQQAHPSIWELATEIVMFRVPTRRQLDRFADLGVPPATLDKVPNLQKFAHIVHRL